MGAGLLRRRAGRTKCGGPFGLEGIASTPSAKRQRLYKHIEPVPGIKIIEHIDTQGEPLFRAIVDGDHEGIVAKRMDAPYRTGPHNAWLEIKNRAYSRREAVE